MHSLSYHALNKIQRNRADFELTVLRQVVSFTKCATQRMIPHSPKARFSHTKSLQHWFGIYPCRCFAILRHNAVQEQPISMAFCYDYDVLVKRLKIYDSSDEMCIHVSCGEDNLSIPFSMDSICRNAEWTISYAESPRHIVCRRCKPNEDIILEW